MVALKVWTGGSKEAGIFTERNLIRKIYVDQIHLRPLAAVMGVTEGTIRYRRDKILRKLRYILENDMNIHSDFFFEN